MNVGLFSVAGKIKAIITEYEDEAYYKYKTFFIDVEHIPPFYFTNIDFNWTTVKNKDVLFVSGIDFRPNIEPAIYLFNVPPKIYKYPKIQIYFNPK